MKTKHILIDLFCTLLFLAYVISANYVQYPRQLTLVVTFAFMIHTWFRLFFLLKNRKNRNIKDDQKKVVSSDWRITSQEKYLFEATFEKKMYQKISMEWDHDHCDFCWETFSEDPKVGLTEGYYSESGDSWVCEQCFNDFKDQFKFKLK